MTGIEEAVRIAVRELADEGRAVYLGDKAVAGAKRRTRRIRVFALAAVAVTIVGALVGPQWTLWDSHGAVPPNPPVTETPSPQPWPVFSGLPRIPAATAGTSAGRLVVAAYQTYPEPPGAAINPATIDWHLLDPVTGTYRVSDVDSVLAASPDLRYALVTRTHEVRDANGGGSVGVVECGIYDMVAGRAVGRIDLPQLDDQSELWSGAWSPDGRVIVLEVRTGMEGRGWLTKRLLFVDVRTGGLRAVDIHPAEGLEPYNLLGWTADSHGVALQADRTGTDDAPRGHLVYDSTGRPVSAHHWPGQRNAVRVIGANQVLLMPMDPGEITVMDLSTGEIQHRYLTDRLRATARWEFPLGWRDGLLLYRSEICTFGGCQDGLRLFGVNPDTGHSQTLYTLPETYRYIVLAPDGGLTGAAATLAW